MATKEHSTKFEKTGPTHFATGGNMKYVKEKRQFTTAEFSTDETVQQAIDVIVIAKSLVQGMSSDTRDREYIINNLTEAEHYLDHIRKKVATALKHVPIDIQEQEHL